MRNLEPDGKSGVLVVLQQRSAPVIGDLRELTKRSVLNDSIYLPFYCVRYQDGDFRVHRYMPDGDLKRPPIPKGAHPKLPAMHGGGTL